MGTGVTSYGPGPTGMAATDFEVRTYVKETLEPDVVWVADVVWDLDGGVPTPSRPKSLPRRLPTTDSPFASPQGGCRHMGG